MKKTISKIALLGVGATLVAAPILTVSCGGSSTPVASNVFWNYEDYIEEGVKDGIVAKGFAYEPFPDLPTFKTQLTQGKAAGGIGSDYFNAELANAGLIKKIDFKAALGFTDAEVASTTALETKLQSIYTPETWKTMAQFDDYVTGGKLYEYTIPYFMQNKVIAVNPYKVTENDTNRAFLTTLKTGTQEEIQELFSFKTYDGILTTLKSNGFDKLAINDYMRDNLMIGSENPTSGAGFTGKMDNAAIADAHLNGFKAMVDKFGKANSRFETSGVDNIKNILRNTSGGAPEGAAHGQAQVALGYNGDALFAQNGLFDDTLKAGEVRIINPMNSMFLMDGFVVSSYASADTTAKIYAAAQDVIYKDYSDVTTPLYDENGDYQTENGVLKNFDYVNYTPAFKAVYNFVMDVDNYFDTTTDEGTWQKDTLASTNAAAGANLAGITVNNVTYPISASIMATINSKYNTYKGSN